MAGAGLIVTDFRAGREKRNLIQLSPLSKYILRLKNKQTGGSQVLIELSKITEVHSLQNQFNYPKFSFLKLTGTTIAYLNCTL